MSSSIVYRKSTWLDTRSRLPKFGIQVRLQKGDPWRHCAEDGKVLIYDYELDRDNRLKEFRAEVRRLRKL